MEQSNLSSLILNQHLATSSGKSKSQEPFQPETTFQDKNDLYQFLSGFHSQPKTPTQSAPPPFFPKKTQAISSEKEPQPISTLNTFAPNLIYLCSELTTHLKNSLNSLLSLNPSRRKALAQHLDFLSGNPHEASSDSLKSFIQSQSTPQHRYALETFIEEVALFSLAQAVLLKSWSDRKIRPWTKQDLKHLNWALSHSLKKHVPVYREGWQITKPNLYSWYSPPESLQNKIWETLNSWNFSYETPSTFAKLIQCCRKFKSDLPEINSYDKQLHSCFWENLNLFGFFENDKQLPSHLSNIKKNKTVFSPTLRDGSFIRCLPDSFKKQNQSFDWVGLESYPFQLMISEFTLLWDGPTTPPLWTTGTGLEVHTREQLNLDWSSPKPSVFMQIAEMEACDLSFVFEERVIRTQGRPQGKNSIASYFCAQLDQLPYYKKIRSGGTSLGDLQACVAMTKLRPGGLMFWAREEPLTCRDGNEFLQFLLNKSVFLCEWNLSSIKFNTKDKAPFIPKYIYLFLREPQLEKRREHHPILIQAQGQLQTNDELSLLLNDVFQSYVKPPYSRGDWKILKHNSPLTQQEWAEHWPDPTSKEAVEKIEYLKENSTPLGQLAIVRSAPGKEESWPSSSFAQGICLTAEQKGEQRRLTAEPLSSNQTILRPETKKNNFLIFLPDERFIAPLCAYLESPILTHWLDFHAERKAGRWNLKEQTIKYLPIPKGLLRAIEEKTYLPSNLNHLIEKIHFHPQNALTEIHSLVKEQDEDILNNIYIQVTSALKRLKDQHSKLFTLVDSSGEIQWSELLRILPQSETVSFSIHSAIRLAGNIPPFLPITKIEKAKIPIPGILLTTESGLHVHISTDTSFIMELTWSQIKDLQHPTWSELTQYVVLPRNPDLAQSTASEVLRSFGEQNQTMSDLQSCLDACSLY